MKKNIYIPYISFVSILLFAACVPQGGAYRCPDYYSQLLCLYSTSVKSFYDRLREDISLAEQKEIEQLDLIREIENTRDISRIPEAYAPIRTLDHRLEFYEGKSDLNIAPFRAANVSYLALAEATARMRLRMGGLHKKFGEKEKARDVYRGIIIQYTGNAYRSYVKQAEFALEDLKIP